ncbi:hypothetical protein [Nonomuraea cavernae]|uniref:Uncharacterized protein n=1 Tax=Nonomuraea cavernae TaxID=2045107 RepID=A0A917YZU7_9ACTN|nr:hypothetical protein [Nonomuraea cavernae]MCA2185959.1 hypothetical protein [Nonomuraea cavernae]GGO69112.1 hypothetical protein GCM10012289_29410 [Nonomuraea cavernae]
MKIRSARVLAILSTAALSSAVLGSSSAAQAIPSSCSFGFYNTNSASYASCSVGTGQFRAKLRCDIPWGIDTVARGHWLNVTVPPSNSIATCPPDARKGYEPGIERQ